MADLTSKNINAGDPVTAELINNIISDLNLINKGTAVSNIVLANTTEQNVSVSSKVYSTTVSQVSVNPSSSPSAKGSWTFPSKVFTKAPRCWIQVNSGGAKLTEAQMRIHTVITSISDTKMTFEVRSGSGAASAKMNFDIFAVEA
jgi:hypothetical protein